jgi:hypothetical protein
MVKFYDGTDQEFLAAWRKAMIQLRPDLPEVNLPRPTARQYRKYLQGRGQAYNARKN